MKGKWAVPHGLLIEVPSDRDPWVCYGVEVEHGRGVWGCSCPDWQYRHPLGGCKHMQSVEEQIAEDWVAGQARIDRFLRSAGRWPVLATR